MINHKYTNAEQKERIRQRVRVQIDEENYQFFPERKEPDYYDNDVNQRVGVYVRVSTDDPVRQLPMSFRRNTTRILLSGIPGGR